MKEGIRNNHYEMPSARKLGLIESLAVLGYTVLTGVTSHKEHRPSIRNIPSMLKLVYYVSQAKKLPPEIFEKLLEKHKIRITGAEHIPEEGNFVLTANHFNQYYLKGMWQTTKIGEIIYLNLLKENQNGYGFIMDGTKTETVDEQADRFREKLSSKFGFLESSPSAKRILDSLEQRTKDYVNPRINQIMANVANSLEFTRVGKPSETISALKNNIVGFFPSGDDEAELKPFLLQAARFLKIASKNFNKTILPVGCYQNGRDMHINFGPLIDFRENSLPLLSNQQIADLVGCNVARLLPPYLWGHYGQFLDQVPQEKIYPPKEPLFIFQKTA